MKNFLKNNYLKILNCFYSLLCALFWTALRVNYAGISKALGAETKMTFFNMYLPVIVLIVMWIIFVSSIIIAFISKRKLPYFIILGLNILNTALCIGIVIGGSNDYIEFILPKFFLSLGISIFLSLIVLLLFVDFENKKLGRIHKVAFVTLCIVTSIFIGYSYKINYFTYDSVVYAVEDKYQIVFSTNDNSLAWVEINGVEYDDLYSGSMKSNDLVHKIEVNQEILDNAKTYTIFAQQIIYRGPFGAYKGKTISKTHSFRPVDTSDGISYYAMSDVHGCYNGAVNSANSIDNLDFLVLMGDQISMVEYASNANYANKLAYAVTKGEIPTIYLRGNHEIKGNYAEELYKYVGSKNEKYYYTFKLSNIYGIVLDLGEDHDDDWWEYYDSSRFNSYRDEQTNFLNDILNKKEYENYDYKMCLCHIPIPMVNYRKNHETYKNEWTSLLNQVGLDIFLSGHQHTLTDFEPGLIEPKTTLTYNKYYKGKEGVTYSGYLTDFNFQGFMVSRPFADNQTMDDIKINRNHYTGFNCQVDLTKKEQIARFINSKGEVVPVCNVFSTNEPREEIKFSLFSK